MLFLWRTRGRAPLARTKLLPFGHHHCPLKTNWWEKFLELILKLLTSQSSWRMIWNRMTRSNPFGKACSSEVLQGVQVALIVKVYGRTVGFNFLHSRIHSLWKLAGHLDCVDLGHDFFLIRFSVKEDFEAVLKKGPWFVGEHFLSIRPWDPNFKLSTANILLVAVWVKLYELPIEYYNAKALQQIGKTIGNDLRVDTHMAIKARGKFARLCV